MALAGVEAIVLVARRDMDVILPHVLIACRFVMLTGGNTLTSKRDFLGQSHCLYYSM